MDNFEQAFKETIGHEGGYSNHPNDRGGETMFGITIAVARANGYDGPMRLMPLDTAKRIYKKQYWDKLNLDQVAKRSPKVSHKLFDIGVNMGIITAGVFLQSTLNIFNRNQKDYSDIKEDGIIGKGTLNALDALMKRRKAVGEILVLKDLIIQQGAKYRNISKNNPSQEDFMVGWYSRIILPYVG